MALAEILRRSEMFESHQVEKEKLSTRERMSQILDRLSGGHFVAFESFFTISEGEVSCCVLLAVMELVKEQLIDFVQRSPLANFT